MNALTQLSLPVGDRLFRSDLMAGFECGLVHGGRHDLLCTTRHTPMDRMQAHLRIARDHGLLTIRDGLVPGHDAAERLKAAHRVGVQAIWDLSHYHRNQDPVRWAQSIAKAAYDISPAERLWLCPVNEPALYPALAGMQVREAVEMAVTMAQVARDHHPCVGILTNDPITGIGERQFAASDAIVSAVNVDVIGVNYYPHTARTVLSKVLLKSWRRYGKPVIVSETSWHDGHPVHHRRHPGFNKRHWLQYVLNEVTLAKEQGVDIAGVCWYPIIDCPPWRAPRSRSRWSHGLIRSDLSVDPELSAAFAEQRAIAAV
ncbi:glycosyl hydrolase 53 family protein [Paracoccus aerius]|uniref:Arabinogalactan endo-beta-1,4-galactanase n=1 Tax=Paracoccus aerius TaxID=1915382 RepID=A0ABS1S9H3_9RHOB|nr:glycosyl hydrolase 53 family protein [Paracoccus aerius]MBL3675210.1 glycosyl hydrolase 53 family protein [Paracoccus aerius]GHG31323.1 beta-glucosidase [Paracoccus aerius]